MSNKKTDIKNKWFNNLENMNHHKWLLEKLIKNDAEEMVRMNCQKIAEGVLYKLFVLKGNSDLIGLLESSQSVKNNLEAVSEWVYRKNPDQNDVDMEVIGKYVSDLEEHLNDLQN